MNAAEKLSYLVSDIFEAHSGRVERGSLLGVANPEADVVETEELSNLRLHNKARVNILSNRSRKSKLTRSVGLS